MTIHDKVEKDIGQLVDFFDNITLRNEVSTICFYNISLNKLTTQIDNVTSLVEDSVVGPQPHYEGQPTVPSVFGRLIPPIGKQQSNVSAHDPTVGGTADPTVLQSYVTDP